MKKILVVCGPTATGKTSLALSLAEKLNGELVSADSRQVYKKLDIGTGKDIPQDAEWRLAKFPISNFQFPIGFWKTKNQIKIWCYDLVEPTEEFSVGQYIKIVNTIIDDIEKRGKVPILVGGTGLYIQGVTEGIATALIPKNEKLRRRLEKKSVEKLFEMLAKLSPTKAVSLNTSDKKNPRRLIRAIEVAKFPTNSQTKNPFQKSLRGASATWQSSLEYKIATLASLIRDDKKSKVYDYNKNVLFIGLTAPKDILNEKIEKRIDKRVEQGIEKEIANLLKQGVNFDNQSMNALGYKQWAQYKSYLIPNTTCSRRKSNYTGQEIRESVIEKWKLAEKQYAKRQMTWFKKNKKINWFDVTKNNWQESVEELVGKWYKLE